MKHFRRWGAVYLLILLFLGSWAAQFVRVDAETSERIESKIDDLRDYLVPLDRHTPDPAEATAEDT